MVAEPDVLDENVTWHEPLESVQLVVVPKVPRLVVHVTVPVGVVAPVYRLVSATVAVHDDVPPTMIVFGVQSIVVEVVLR